jgi:hypothetical protein
MRSLSMRFLSIEDLCYRLALVRSESSNIHQRPDLPVCGRGNHGAGVGVSGKQNRAVGSLENVIQRSGVV